MAPLRLRHPKGVSTLQVDFETSTVLDLQQAILAASDIPPSAQDRTHLSPPSFSSNEIVHYALCANQSKQATRPAPSPQSSLSFRSPASALPRASSSSSPRNQALLLLLRLPSTVYRLPIADWILHLSLSSNVNNTLYTITKCKITHLLPVSWWCCWQFACC